jgi:hypothetical protein
MGVFINESEGRTPKGLTKIIRTLIDKEFEVIIVYYK